MGTTSAAARRLPVAATLGCAAVVALAGCAAAGATPTDPPAVRTAPAGPIPASAGVVTLSENLGLNAHGKRPPAPATINSKAIAGQLAALIDAQKPFPPGRYSCPMDDGQSVTLTFRDSPGGPVVATATLATSGCQAIGIAVDGKTKPSRGPAGRAVTAKAIKIAGLHWKLPTLG